MGAHSASGHVPVRTVTAAAGVAAVLVTSATTGLLTGGTALASDGSDGHGHSHGSRGPSGIDQQTGGAADSIAAQTLCDVLGDVPLGVGSSCPSGSGSEDSSSDQDQDSGSYGSDGTGGSSRTQTATARNASAAPAAPAPQPRPASAVPAQPQLLKIGG